MIWSWEALTVNLLQIAAARSMQRSVEIFVSNAGITVRGEVDEHGMFSYEYYFPHYTGHQISLTDDVSVEKISEREEYVACVMW